MDRHNDYAKLVARLRPQLGFSHHTRLLATHARRRATPSESATSALEVDVIEHFHYPSEAAFRSALESNDARRAFAELAASRRPRMEWTAAIAGPVHSLVPYSGSWPAARVLVLLRRAFGRSRSEMQRYWRETHGPLVASLKPDLRMAGYEQHHSVFNRSAEEVAMHLGIDDGNIFDGAASLIYSSTDALFGALRSDRGRAADRRLSDDEEHFVSSADCIVVMGEER